MIISFILIKMKSNVNTKNYLTQTNFFNSSTKVTAKKLKIIQESNPKTLTAREYDFDPSLNDNKILNGNNFSKNSRYTVSNFNFSKIIPGKINPINDKVIQLDVPKTLHKNGDFSSNKKNNKIIRTETLIEDHNDSLINDLQEILIKPAEKKSEINNDLAINENKAVKIK